jgi:hypothetical protein
MPVAAGAKIIASDIPLEEYPIGRCVQGAAQNVPDSVITPLSWTVEEFDTHGQHDPVVNNTRITPNVPGYYEFTGTYYTSAPATLADMDAFFRMNGAGGIASGDRSDGGNVAQSRSARCIQPFNGTTDYMELCAWQNSAGDELTNVSSRFTSFVEWKYLRPL